MGSNAPGQWPAEHHDALVGFIAAGLSFAEAATAINKQFHSGYTRCAAIGRGSRTGIVQPTRTKVARAPRKPQPYKPRPRPVASVPRAIPISCQEITPLHLTLVDLETGDCRYPFGEGPFTFCGHPSETDSSYCPAHHHLCLKRGEQ